jgi:hypothetical protein
MNELEIPDDTGPDEHVDLATDSFVIFEGETKVFPGEKRANKSTRRISHHC